MSIRWCLVLAVPALACGPPPAAAPGTAAAPFAVSEVPGLGLEPANDVVGLSAAVGPGGAVHLAWSAALAGAPGAVPSYRTFHARGDRRGERWSARRTRFLRTGQLDREMAR